MADGGSAAVAREGRTRREGGRLTVKGLEKLLQPGRYGDGAGLWFQVRAPDQPAAGSRPTREVRPTRSWLFRFAWQGRQRQLGLGPYPEIGLAEARDAAARARRMVLAGVDPIAAKREQAAETARAARTFEQAAGEFIEAREPSWRNDKHAAQWRATLAAYAFPVIGRLPVAEVDTAHVLAILRPVWAEKPETASRLRGRIEAILAAEAVAGQRSRENPAAWRNHLDKLLPARSKVAPVEHHAALPWADLPAFFVRLQAADGIGARALELAILTAARTGEVLGATWGEIDMEGRVWTVPASRMKAGREHRVPLSEPAIALLRRLATLRDSDGPEAFVFPGQRHGAALSNMAMAMALRRLGRDDITAHGFRSTFRDWAAERSGFPGEVAEAALAHVVGDKVEAAYRRGDLFEKRARLMAAWSAYATKAPAAVVPLRPARA